MGLPRRLRKVLVDFDSLPESDVALPEYAHAHEGEYNEAVPAALTPSYCCTDRRMISHRGGHSTIEFVLTGDKKLIHVKHYSGAAQLSHLFNQGVVSGELFVQEEAFRNEVNQKLPVTHKLSENADEPYGIRGRVRDH